MGGKWRKVAVGQIAATVRNALVGGPFGSNLVTRDYAPSGVPVIRGQNMGSRWVSGEFVFVSDAKADALEANIARPWDIVFTQRGTLGQVSVVPKHPNARYLVSQSQMKLTVNRELADPLFFYYVFSTTEQQDYIRQHAIQTGVPHTNLGVLRETPVPLPPIEEQRAIAHILGTLDDKIELNRRMSETLEAMARALFKAWFVDFEPVRAKQEGRWQRGQSLPGLPAHLYDLLPDRLVDSELGEIPKGWQVGAIGRFFTVGLGGVWGKDEQSARATVPMRCLRGIDCHDLAEGRIPEVPTRWVSPKQATDRQLSDGTILIEGSGSFCGRSMIWRRAYADLLVESVGYSNFCKRLDPLCGAAQATICWMQMRQAYRDGLLQSFRTGTAFPNFDVHGALSNLIVVVPPMSVADVFGKMFGLSQRLDLMAQSRTLAALRDTLLPKLISGELRVPDAERWLEAAQ